MNDEQLVSEVLRNNTDSYRELIERYQSKLIAYVIYLTGNHMLADDVVQDTFIKAYQNLQSFNPSLKFSSWVYRIAHNEAMNAIKKHKRELYLDDVSDWDNFVDVRPEIGEEIDRELERGKVKGCLSALDQKYRDVIVLFYLQGKSYEEISDILRTPKATVGVRIARGRLKLKEICKRRGLNYEKKG